MASSVERLKAIGQWMQVNGEAIYGTTASPFPKFAWGRCTKKIKADGGTLYLHVFNWSTDGRLVLPGLRSKVLTAHLLATNQAVTVKSEADNVVLSLPGKAPDDIASVIEVKYSGPRASK